MQKHTSTFFETPVQLTYGAARGLVYGYLCVCVCVCAFVLSCCISAEAELNMDCKFHLIKVCG